MTLTDEDVAAIDAAAEVLRRVLRVRDLGVRSDGPLSLALHVRLDGQVELLVQDLGGYSCPFVRAHLDGKILAPGEALRRLVAR